MRILLNGQVRDIPARSTVQDLLRSLQLDKRFVAVEVNGEVVSRQQHSERVLEEEDRLEIVTLVGGG